jgi:hypothetical protein
MQWYYSKNGTQLGPVEEGELRAKLAAGEVSQADLVWKDGMPDWQPAARVAELTFSPFSASPTGSPQATAGTSPYSPPVHASYGGFAPAPTSGLAIASLVCGIMGLVTCLFLPGIPAVICGHMALSRMAEPNVRLAGRGMAIAGLIMGYLSILIAVGFVLVVIIGVIAEAGKH